MSTMIVKVRKIDNITKHPNADRLEICDVGGWKTATQKGQFVVGQKCVYFPPDSVLPLSLANGEDDDPVGRLNVSKYCGVVKDGKDIIGYRVKAARLRGQPSFGVIMAIDLSKGDKDWDIDTDVADFYGVTKWEPVLICEDGDAAPDHRGFYRYTDIEHFSNFPDAIADEEEVVITEKLHGKNTRMGMVADAEGWIYMAGSHDVPRKEKYTKKIRLDAIELKRQGFIQNTKVSLGQVISRDGQMLRVDEIKPNGETWFDKLLCLFKIKQPKRKLFKATEIRADGKEILYTSDFWTFYNDDVKKLMNYIRELPWSEPKNSIILYGELFGQGVQTMHYGRDGRDFRVFDICINGQYVDYENKMTWCKMFGIQMVPCLYKGPFSREVVEKYTDGPTTCLPDGVKIKKGQFAGREGCVITPAKERFSSVLGGRCILKSVSVDYLNEKNMSDGK